MCLTNPSRRFRSSLGVIYRLGLSAYYHLGIDGVSYARGLILSTSNRILTIGILFATLVAIGNDHVVLDDLGMDDFILNT
jgi:hypothetical protein